jgi:hypothetical protein
VVKAAQVLPAGLEFISTNGVLAEENILERHHGLLQDPRQRWLLSYLPKILPIGFAQS